MTNTGDDPATILIYDMELPEVVLRQFVRNKPVIPGERVQLKDSTLKITVPLKDP